MRPIRTSKGTGASWTIVLLADAIGTEGSWGNCLANPALRCAPGRKGRTGADRGSGSRRVGSAGRRRSHAGLGLIVFQGLTLTSATCVRTNDVQKTEPMLGFRRSVAIEVRHFATEPIDAGDDVGGERRMTQRRPRERPPGRRAWGEAIQRPSGALRPLDRRVASPLAMMGWSRLATTRLVGRLGGRARTPAKPAQEFCSPGNVTAMR